MNPIYITDLSAFKPQKALTTRLKKGCWRIWPYQADNLSGTMLYAVPDPTVPKLYLPLQNVGWHAIYFGCMPTLAPQSLRVRLDNDRSFVAFEPYPIDASHSVTKTFYLEEGFWKNADLTKRTLIIAPQTGLPRAASLAYIKLVPLDHKRLGVNADNHASGHKPLVAMCDGYSFLYSNHPLTPEQIYEQLEPFKNTFFKKIYWGAGSGGDICCYPTKVGEVVFSGQNAFNDQGQGNVCHSVRTLIQNGIDILKVARDYAGSINLGFHISLRMGAFAHTPECFPTSSRFYLKHPEWHCIDRDGRSIARLSYAYRGVQKHMLDLIDELLSYEPEGINLIWVRGPSYLLYEDPIVNEFKSVHGLDARRIAPDNQKWLYFRAGIMTEFMRQIRHKTNEHGKKHGKKIELSCMVFPTERMNMFYGLNIEAWIKEGLVDVLVPCKNSYITEDIDVEMFRRITEKTACSWYGFMRCWGQPHELPLLSKDALYFYDAGAGGLCFWDIENYYRNLHVWSVVKNLSDHKYVFKHNNSRLAQIDFRYKLHCLDNYRVNVYPPGFGS